MPEYYIRWEWTFAAVLVVCFLWPCVYFFRGKTSTLVASIMVGLHLAPCWWLTLFDPNWNGWVPSARVTHGFVMSGLFGEDRLDFYFRPYWWGSMAVTAIVAFVARDRVKARVKRKREMAETQVGPPFVSVGRSCGTGSA